PPTTAAHRAPTPTATLVPTTPPRPTATVRPAGAPCGTYFGQGTAIAATVGDLQFSAPHVLSIDPPRQLPDNLPSQPYAVNATVPGYLDGLTWVNAHMYEYTLCNNSATAAHTLGQFTVKLTSFSADANTINTTHQCIRVYSPQGMLDHTGCGGAFGGGDVSLVASFAATAAAGTVQPALVSGGQQAAPLTVLPGYAIEVEVDVTPATVAGTAVYRFGVGVDGAAPVYPNVDAPPILNTTTTRQWDGTACLSAAMQALIPAPTTPPTYYICPQA
ncbi:MAG TPA: hypothetical protein VGR57_16630, partial [Ktedonobacterales bacterium]|nr:hypothetical protein [Ktedonobacterales bacterium]